MVLLGSETVVNRMGNGGGFSFYTGGKYMVKGSNWPKSILLRRFPRPDENLKPASVRSAVEVEN